MIRKPFIVAEGDLPLEGWNDPDRGGVTWCPLFSAESTPTDSFTSGIAYFAPGQELRPHRHAPPELYFLLEGELEVTIDGEKHAVKANTAIYIPGDAEHGARNAGAVPARLFYCFAKDRLSEVDYRFAG